MTNSQMREAILLALKSGDPFPGFTAKDVFPELIVSPEIAEHFGECVYQLRRDGLIRATDNDGDPEDPSFMDVELTLTGRAMVEALSRR